MARYREIKRVAADGTVSYERVIIDAESKVSTGDGGLRRAWSQVIQSERVADGLCPACGSVCYGDCGSSR